MQYYAVIIGRNIGVYNNWTNCAKQIINYPGGSFKKFRNFNDAESYIINNTDVKQVTFFSEILPPISDKYISKNLSFMDIPIPKPVKIIKKNRYYDKQFVGCMFVYVYSILNDKEDIAGVGIYFEPNSNRNASRILNDIYTEHDLQLKTLQELYNIIKQNLMDDLKITIVMESQYAIDALNDTLTKKTVRDRKIIKQLEKLFGNFDNLRFLLLQNNKNNLHNQRLLEAKKLGNLAIGLIV